MQVNLIFKNTLHHKTHFAYSVSPLYRHGRRWFQTVVSFSIEKLIVEQCTRPYTAQQPSTAYPPTHKCVNSRAPSQPEAKNAAPAVSTAVVPLAYSAAALAVAPTAATKDAGTTRRGPLRIGNCVSLYSAVPIKTPFPDIPAHIV